MKKSWTRRFSFFRGNTVVALTCLSSLAFGQQPVYEVYAIEFAGSWRESASGIAVGATKGDSISGGNFIWLLKGNNGRTVLVDAGYTDTSRIRTPNWIRPDSALLKMNVRPDEITDLIITHPHGDHVGGINLFPNAKLWMQIEDYNFFVGEGWQKKGIKTGFFKADVLKLVQKNLDGKLTLVKGDSVEIIPGIRVFIGSKHTWESQYLLVNGTSGKTLIASDGIWFYYNLEHLLPIPTYTFDPQAYVRTMERMKTLVDNGDLIIPGHDARVLDKFPKVVDRVAKIELKGK